MYLVVTVCGIHGLGEALNVVPQQQMNLLWNLPHRHLKNMAMLPEHIIGLQ